MTLVLKVCADGAARAKYTLYSKNEVYDEKLSLFNWEMKNSVLYF